MSSGVRRLWCGMRTIGAVGYIALLSVSPALSLPYIPEGNNQTFISGFWVADNPASPYYSLGSDSEYALSYMSINAHNVRWLPGTDGILQKETDSIEALYRFSINNQNVNGGFYQYDENNDIYGTAPNGWNASGTALTAATIESCYGLESGGITNFTVIGGPTVFIGDLTFFGVVFDYQGYRYTLGVDEDSAVNTRAVLNAPPTLSGAPVSLSAIEDVTSSLSLADLSFGDEDGDTLTVTLTVSTGIVVEPVSANGVIASRPFNDTIVLLGSAGDINSWLDANSIAYSTPKNAVGTSVATLEISASDGTADLASNAIISIDSTNTPDVTNVTANPATGYYQAGDVVRIEVVFDEAVNVANDVAL